MDVIEVSAGTKTVRVNTLTESMKQNRVDALMGRPGQWQIVDIAEGNRELMNKLAFWAGIMKKHREVEPGG